MNKKRILTIIIAIAVGFGAVAGVSAAVRKTTSGNTKVMVIQAGELNYGYGDWDSESMEGYVTSDRVQNVNVDDSHTVSEIKVEEGQNVKKGDVLLVYDMMQTEVKLEKEKLSLERIKMSIENGEKMLQKLKQTRPVSDSGDSDDDIDDDFDEDSDDDDIKIKKPKLYDKLNGKSKPYYERGEDAPEPGSDENPYRYLCKPGTTVTSDFINAAKKLKNDEGDCYIVLEIRDPETKDGKLVRAWKQNINELQVDREWVGVLDPDSDRPVIPTMTYLDIEELKKKAEDLGKKEKEQAKQIKELEKELEQLKKEASAQDDENQSADPDNGDQAGELQQKISELEQANQALSEELEALKAGSSESGESEESSDDLKNRIQELEQENAELKAQIEALKGSAEGSGEGSGEAVGFSTRTDLPVVELASVRTVKGLYHASGAPKAVLTALSGDEDDDADEGDDADSDDGSADLDLSDLNADLEYTAEELRDAIKAQEESLKDLKLDQREAEIKIGTAEKALEDGTVKAAMDGVVTIVSDPETSAVEGTPLIQVAGTSGVAIKGGLRESLLDSLHEGDHIAVMSWSNGIRYTATITEISPYPDTSGMFEGMGYNNSYYPFTAIVEDEDAELEDHDWVQISVDANTLANDEDGFYLMKAFILEEGNTAYVYLRGKDGLLKRQNVQLGKLSGDSYEIRRGVTEEDWIAFPYGKNIKEGAETYEGSFEQLYGGV